MNRGVRAVERCGSRFPLWIGEASSTLPRKEEEPLRSSYAAAGGIGKTAGEELDDPNHRAKGRLRRL